MTSFYNYGDAGALQAQVIQSLDSIPQGDFFELRRDPNQFNVWQKTIINDDISEYINYDVYPITSESRSLGDIGENFTNFDFRLMGMTDMRKICFQIKFVYDTYDRKSSLDTVYQCAMGLLHAINRVNIKLGQQLHDINKEQTNNINFMYAWLSDSLFSAAELSIIKRTVGNIAPEVRLIRDDEVYNPSLTKNIITSLYSKDWKSIGLEVIINIPLWLINPFFFQRKTYLPTDLRMNIEFFTKPAFEALRLLQVDSNYTLLKIRNISILKMMYQIQIPKPDILAQLNQNWFKNKLMYNYLRYEFKEYYIEPNQIQNNLEKTFCFDYTPLSIVLVPYTKGFNKTVKFKYPYGIPKKLYAEEFYPIPVNYSRILITQNGREIYSLAQNEFKSYNRTNEYGHEIFELINSEYRGVGSDFSKSSHYSNSCIDNTHSPLTITLDPSTYFTKNVISSRASKANTTILVNFDYISADTITEGFYFRIYYSYIRQLTISPEKNVMDIDWPVISSSSNQAFIQNTFNTN